MPDRHTPAHPAHHKTDGLTRPLFRVFGGPAITVAGTPVRLRGRTPKRVLAMLLARYPQRVPVTVMVDALWNEYPPPQAVRNVHSYVSKLARVITNAAGRDLIDTSAGGYTLTVPAEQIDAQEFDRHVTRAQTQQQRRNTQATLDALHQARALWDAEPYVEVDGWDPVQPEVDHLVRIHLQAIELAIEAGSGIDVVPWLERITRARPYEERPAGLLMRALSAVGDRASAMQIYHDYRSTLVEELGIDPSRDLRQVYEHHLLDDLPQPTLASLHVGSTPSDPPVAGGARTDRSNADAPEHDSVPSPLLLLDRMPQQPRLWIDRSGLLAQISDLAYRQQVIGVTGRPGVGKTQLAAAYVRARLAAEPTLAAVWVAAHTTEHMTADLAEVAVDLGLADGAEVQQAARRGLRALSRAPQLVMVFDNAPSPTTVWDWLSPVISKGAVVIVTSHNQQIKHAWDTIEIEPMTREEARSYLEQATGLPADEHTDQIIELVDYSTMGLTLAAATINTQRLTYDEYLRQLQVLPTEDLLAPVESDPYPTGLGEAILITLHTAIERDDACEWLAEALAYLDGARMDRGLLIPSDADDVALAIRSRALSILSEVGLIDTSDRATICMHPLVARVIRDRCAATGRMQTTITDVLPLLDGYLARNQPTRLSTVRQVLHHLTALLHAVPADQLTDPETLQQRIDLCDKAIEASYNLADFLGAARLVGLVHDELIELAEPTDQRTIRARIRLAHTLRQHGQARHSLTMLEPILDHQIQHLGAEHADTLTTRYELATTAYSAGQPHRAIDHLDTLLHDADLTTPASIVLAARRRLGFTRRSIGDAHGSDAIYQVLVADYQHHYGPDHPQTLRTISEHAVVQRNLTNVEEAERLLHRCLQTRAANHHSEDHPDRLHDRARLAGVWRATGRASDAAEEFAVIHQYWHRELGDHHPWTLLAGNNLAVARSHHDVQAAINLLHRVCEAHANSPGHDLPRAWNARHNRACLHARAGDLDTAIEQLRTVHTARTDLFGPDHPDTTTSSHALAAALTATGDEQAVLDILDGAGPRPPDHRHPSSTWAAGHSTDETLTLAPPQELP